MLKSQLLFWQVRNYKLLFHWISSVFHRRGLWPSPRHQSPATPDSHLWYEIIYQRGLKITEKSRKDNCREPVDLFTGQGVCGQKSEKISWSEYRLAHLILLFFNILWIVSEASKFRVIFPICLLMLIEKQISLVRKKATRSNRKVQSYGSTWFKSQLSLTVNIFSI